MLEISPPRWAIGPDLLNHYPHHLGDYAKDTLGLTQGEHGAYCLLLHAYYAAEEAPAAEDVYAIAKASTPAERKAVDKVLRKFELRDGRYYHKRVEEELAAYYGRADSARVNGKKGGRPKTKPTDNPRVNPQITEQQTETVTQSEPTEKLASSHKPVTSNQNLSVASATVFDKALAASASAAALPLSEARINPDTPAGILASVCVANSIQATAFHPLVVEWARDGVTVEGLKSAIATARIRKPSPQKIPVAYLDTILADVGSPKVDARWRTDDGECERVARELGLWPARAKESWNDLRNRIAEALHSEARKAVQ